jgi:hypothetical protein
MKKIFLAAMFVLVAINLDASQDSLFINKYLNNLPQFQTVVVYEEDSLVAAKGAEAFGHGIEPFVGVGFMSNSIKNGAFITPEVGLRYRHDWQRVSLAVGASVLTRQYNAEAIDAGKRYFSYGADATFHVNVLRLGQYEHILNIYAQGGYIFGKHRKAIEELNGAPLYHNGSGLTWGGGIEYRWQIHATGNALTLRVGYKDIPSTFVNDTKHPGMIYMNLGFNIGIKRNRINTFK